MSVVYAVSLDATVPPDVVDWVSLAGAAFSLMQNHGRAV